MSYNENHGVNTIRKGPCVVCIESQGSGKHAENLIKFDV